MIRFVPANAQHIGNRQYQQDSFGFSDLGDSRFLDHGGFVAIVADGMGGLAHGDEASRLAVKTFLEAYAAKVESETAAHALERALRAANEAVYDLAVRAGAPGDVGTTLIAVALKPEGLHWISVGDSAIYLYRDGELTLITTSHVYAHTLDAMALQGHITAEQAQSDPQRDALTSYVGAPQLGEVDRNVRPFPVRAGDAIVLASDGLFKTLPESEIAATLDSAGERAPEALVRKTLACEKEHQDNVTVCMVRVESGALAPVPATVELPRTKALPVEPAAPPKERRGPAPSGATRVSRTRRLVFLFVALALFGAAASFIGWVIARETPDPVNDTTPKGATGGPDRPAGDVQPGTVEPVQRLPENQATPPPREPTAVSSDPPAEAKEKPR